MKTCFGYVRVSTVKQGDGVSLEAQRDAILAFASRNNLTIDQWFEEKETAAKRGRPIFNKMISELKRRKADGVIFHKIDRSARNFADWARIGDLAEAGIDVHFATESLDFRSRGGRLAADIQAVVAADYIRNLRDETIKGLEGRLKQGVYPFRAPIGYLDQGKGNPKSLDPLRAPLVRELFEMYATGEYSMENLVVQADMMGLRNRWNRAVSKAGIEAMLGNPFYAGVMHIKRTGRSYSGNHQPLISPSLFQTVTDVRLGRGVKKTTQHNLRLRGLFRCRLCQKLMIGERQKGHVYYRCHTRLCPTKSIREEKIEAKLGDTLAKASISDADAASLRELFLEWYLRRPESGGGDIVKLELQKLDNRLSRLTDKLIDGLVDDQTYCAKKDEILKEQVRWRQRLAAESTKEEFLANLEKFLELAKSLCQLYVLGDRITQRAIIKFATSNRLIALKNVEIEPSNDLLSASNALSGDYCDPNSSTYRTLQEFQTRVQALAPQVEKILNKDAQREDG